MRKGVRDVRFSQVFVADHRRVRLLFFCASVSAAFAAGRRADSGASATVCHVGTSRRSSFSDGHFISYHRILSQAKWSMWRTSAGSVESCGRVLAGLALALVPDDRPVVLVVDDTARLSSPTSDVTIRPEPIVSLYTSRWPLETTFQEARLHLGLETPRQRCEKSVLRTTA